MMSILDSPSAGLTRRELVRLGGLGLLGLSMPSLLEARQAARPSGSFGRAKACIILFMFGGPPQHETWDPKPDAPVGIRGDFKPIATAVPGIQVGELMPRVARLVDRICILRAAATNDTVHISSSYAMATGFQDPGALNNKQLTVTAGDWPWLGSVVHRFKSGPRGLPVIMLPELMVNDPREVYPGQNAGFLGRSHDPLLLECDPSLAGFQVPGLRLATDLSLLRLERRRGLLEQLGSNFDQRQRGQDLARLEGYRNQAFALLGNDRMRRAFDLDREPAVVRDRYGRHIFGQSCLLARRFIEAGVPLVQVNWARDAEGGKENPGWDTHARNTPRLKNSLMPPMDLAYSALLQDLEQRGLLDETLVVWMGEFGRTPKINAHGGRDHWGQVFSLALAGAGIRGGQVFGASDRIGALPRDGLVHPPDLTATIFHCLGLAPDLEIRDALGRPLPISRGSVLHQLF